MATCETCRFSHIRWRKGDPYEGYHGPRVRDTTSVECRRYAPSGPVVTTEATNAVENFPWLDGSDWCGEHQPKETNDEA
jgi:hypothetical protein